MKNENQKNTKSTGVTMVALVVTLIVMLILAGVTISMITSSGVLENAEEASSLYEKANEQESISVAFATVFSKSMTTDTAITADNLENELEKAGIDATVTVDPDDDTKLNVEFDKTHNQHSVDTETGQIDYEGSYPILDQDGEDVVSANLATATFKLTSSVEYYTNQNITVTIEKSIAADSEDYIFEYRIGSSGTWTEYTEELTITENTTVYARMRYLRKVSEYGTLSITNIDKTAPVVEADLAIMSQEVGVNTVTASITVNDSWSGLAAIVWYYMLPEDTDWQSVIDEYQEINSYEKGTTGTVTKTHDFSGFSTAGSIKVYAIAYDVAGNSIQNYSETTAVEETITVYVTSITLAGSSVSGSSSSSVSTTLTATVEPSDATNSSVTWTSSNTSVATVSSSGVVTRKANGTATITCTSTDGSGVIATVTITTTGSTTTTSTKCSGSGQSCKVYKRTYDDGTLRHYSYHCKVCDASSGHHSSSSSDDYKMPTHYITSTSTTYGITVQ